MDLSERTLQISDVAFAAPSYFDDACEPAAAPATFHVERVAALSMIGNLSAWQDLCARALEPNVFLEPAFALPLLQHVESTGRPDFLLVWEENGPASFGRLVGLLPCHPARAMSRRILRGFTHNQVRLGAPLIDRDRGPEAFEAILDWLGAREPKAATLLLSCLDAEGPFVDIVAGLGLATRRGISRLDEHRRAVLRHQPEGPRKIMPMAQAKHRKELGRQRRRLSEQGARAYVSARTPAEVARATERFLALEHDGWKGGRGTALLADPTLATFTRSMTRLMAEDGRCRIDSIEIDGKAVAMGIVLTIGDRAHFWKTTFNEAFAPLSPGVQFTLELTEAQLGDPAVALTDSCAVPDHPMIDRLWHERMTVTDLMIGLRPDDFGAFGRAVRGERRYRALRARFKAWARRLGRR